MRRVGEIDIQHVLPLDRYVRLAVDYANLKSLDVANLHKLALDAYGFGPRVEGRVWNVDLRGSIVATMTKVAARSRTHTWIRGLVDAAADDKPLRREDEQELVDTFSGQKLTLDLAFRAGALESEVRMPDADLLWFFSIGCAALFDKHGPYYRLVRRCDDFAGSTYTKVKSKACGNYALLISNGGRTPERFCSRSAR